MSARIALNRIAPAWATITAGLLAIATTLDAQDRPPSGEDGPLFDFEEFVVNYHPTDFRPSFRVENPTFAYYDTPELERGDLILALEFMDRYRDSVIPGDHKWSGMLHFPVIDGEERKYLKWLCLYFYNNRMFAYDPTGQFESEKRFFVPISYENRMNRDVLFQFATSYVEEIFPEREEDIYLYEDEIGLEDEEYSFTETIETIYIAPGRIAPVLNAQRKKKPEELVRLIYRYEVDPNPGKAAEVAFGKGEDFGKTKFDYGSVWDELVGYRNNIHIARQLLAPRWSQKIYFHYTKNLWILPDMEAKASALAFNIGTRIYVYSPKYGVWRTGATIDDLNDRKQFAAKLRYPGIDEIDRVEFVSDTVDGEKEK